MTFKTIKRRKQRRKQIFVKAKRKRWLESLRQEAYEDWLRRYNEKTKETL